MACKTIFVTVLAIGLASMQGCGSTSVCSTIDHAERTKLSCERCGCFELVSIGGGFVGGTLDAKSMGLFQALVIKSDSVLDYYDHDTLLWSHTFKLRRKSLGGTRSQLTVLDTGSDDRTFAFKGRDTIVAFHEGWIDDSPLTFVRN